MAAAITLPPFISEQENNLEGHTTRIIETLQSFGSRLPFDFEKSFRFDCWEVPTSWSLRLAFRRVPTDGCVTCEVTIQRLDHPPVAMGTDFWMKPILLTPFSDLFIPNLRVEDMFPNDQGRRIIQLMPKEALMQLGDLPLRLEMFFRVRRCHHNMFLEGLVHAVHPEKFPPPAAFEEMFVAEST